MPRILIIILAITLFFTKGYALQVGLTTVTYVDSSRNNRQIETKIYYPAVSAGNNTQIATGVFPAIAFGHGFVMTWSAYQNFWEALVPEGYILAFPTTEGGISPNHTEFAKDLFFIVTQLQANGAGAVIPKTSISSKSAIMGHSMGGGCSFLATHNNVSITTMISFAAANTNPSSIAASQQVSIPTLLFSGSNDCVAPPSQHQDIMFDSSSAAFKTQINIIGGGHCFFANSNFNCTFGESTCTPIPTILREEQQASTQDFLKLWLGYYLKDECAKAIEFQDSLFTSSRISYRQNQPIFCATGMNSYAAHPSFLAYPNPFSNALTIDLNSIEIKNITIFNLMMQKIGEYKFFDGKGRKTIELSHLANGLYFIQMNQSHWFKVWKRGFE